MSAIDRATDALARARAEGATAADRRGPLLVEAAAGTGKTRALVGRALAYVRAGERRLSEMAIVTFTEAAAAQLRERLRARLLEELAATRDARLAERWREALADLETAAVGTIHAFCLELLKRRPVEAGVDPAFAVADPLGQRLRQLGAWARLLAEVGSEAAGLEAAADLDLLSEPQLRKTALALLWVPEADLPRPLRAGELGFAERWREIGALIERAQRAAFPGGSLARKLAETADAHARLGGFGEPERQRRLLQGSLPLPPAHYGQRRREGEAIELRDQLNAAVEDLRTDLAHDRLTTLARWLSRLSAFYAEDNHRASLLDFDQLLGETRDLLRRHPAVLADFQREFPVILVDEFQDTDSIQTEILRLLGGQAETDPDGKPRSLFLVGDPKQSIYRFRGADLENYNAVRRAAFAGDRTEYLSATHRPAPELAHWVNAALERVMGDGGEDWEAAYRPLEPRPLERLPERRGVLYLELPRFGSAKPRVPEATETEARALAWLAARIVAEKWQVRDQESGRLRAAGAGDCVLLLRKLTLVDHYERAFAERDLAVRVIGGRHYYRRDEVHALVEILRALADPGDPVATVAALRGPGFGCSDSELAAYALVPGGARLDHAAVTGAARLGAAPDPDRARQTAAALGQLAELRAAVAGRPLAEAVGTVVERTGLLPFFALLDRGDQRVANLLKAVDLARRMEGAGVRGLNELVRWLGDLLDEEIEEEDSPYLEGADEVLRIVSIHRAKGLEFPIVLLGGMAGGDASEFGLRVLRRRDGGLALHLGRGKGKLSLGTRGHQAAWEDERARQTAEDKRLLYVASTRARDLLVLPALAAGVEPPQPRSALFTLLDEARAARPEGLPEAPAELIAVPDLGDPPAGPPPRLDLGRLDPALGREIAARRAEWAAAERRALDPAIVRPSDVELPADLSGDADAGAEGDRGGGRLRPPDPGRAQRPAATMGSARRVGGAAHALLAAALGGGAPPALPLLAGERETAERLAQRFLDSDLARRARAAVDRVIEEPLTLPFPDGRLVDGVLDLAFLEPSGWVLVDYKSDRATAAEVPAHALRYLPQLALYGYALERLTGRPVAEAHLFFLAPGTSQVYARGALAEAAAVTSVAATISSAGSSAT